MNSLSKILQHLDFSSIKCERIATEEFDKANLPADVLRLDRIHPVFSGNKWFKLKYYLVEAMHNKATTIVTFGGSWSNHIVATAWACREAGIFSVGIIRGEEPKVYSGTLVSATDMGMKLVFVSRDQYNDLADNLTAAFKKRHKIPGDAFLIPAGGEGSPGVKGASEIAGLADMHAYSHIACSIGTSTMFAGLVMACSTHQTIIGIPALKGFQAIPAELTSMIQAKEGHAQPYIADNFHFGGYARKTPELIGFMNDFYDRTGIETDFVYTGKLFFACARLASENFFPAGKSPAHHPQRRFAGQHLSPCAGFTFLTYRGKLLFSHKDSALIFAMQTKNQR